MGVNTSSTDARIYFSIPAFPVDANINGPYITVVDSINREKEMEGRFTATTNPVSQDLQSEAVIIQPAQQAMSIPRRLARELAHLAPFWCPDQEGEGIYLYSMWRDRDLETGALEAKAEAISHYVERDGLIVELEADWADDDLQAYLVEQANDEIRADADAYYDYRTRG